MTMRRSAVALALLCACVGCSVERSHRAEQAQTTLVGLPKRELYRCAGLPDKQETLGDTEYLTYDNDLLTSGGVTAPIIGGGINFFDSKYCHATFLLRGGTIAELHYAGNASSSFAPLDQCGYIIDACLAHVDQPR